MKELLLVQRFEGPGQAFGAAVAGVVVGVEDQAEARVIQGVGEGVGA